MCSLDPSLVLPNLLVGENVGSVSVCVEGGMETVPIRMLVMNTSTASEAGDFIVLNAEDQELDPGDTFCFDIGIIDDQVNENPEYIDIFIVQGNDTNATFTLDGRIRILDNDFSKAYIM